MSYAASAAVLLVDDEPVLRIALARLLEERGYEVAAFADAEAALRWARNYPQAPLMALVDLDLPGMSGAELLKELDELYPDVPQVLITAADRDRVRQVTREVSPQVLRKPFEFDTLMRMVRQWAV